MLMEEKTRIQLLSEIIKIILIRPKLFRHHYFVGCLLFHTTLNSKYHVFYKKIKSLILLVCIAGLISSCEKIIDVDIDNASKKYVIEGEVSTNTSIGSQVRLSQTKNFSDDNSFNGVSGATVTIQVNNGPMFNLTETTTGIYTRPSLVGVSGSIYKLTVTINGSTFTAVSTVPGYVSLDTITAEYFSFGGSNQLQIYPSYKDPPGLGNSYRFVEYRNNKQVKNIFVQNDALSDGKTITKPLLNRDSELEVGDSVLVVMKCIDPNVYLYWFSLDQSATGNSQATPANPVSNINGGAIGVFSANTYSEKKIKIK